MDSNCTCPSGDGSLNYPCPRHPSPAGQVHGEESCEEIEAELQFYREEAFNLPNILIGAGVFSVDHEGDYKAAWANIMDAIERLAARQPVGQEPVAWVSPGQLEEFRNGTSSFGSRIPVRIEKGGLFDMPLYAAPPAQETALAVDLGQFREMAEFVEEFVLGVGCAPKSSRMYEQARRLLALIDSQK